VKEVQSQQHRNTKFKKPIAESHQQSSLNGMPQHSQAAKCEPKKPAII